MTCSNTPWTLGGSTLAVKPRQVMCGRHHMRSPLGTLGLPCRPSARGGLDSALCRACFLGAEPSAASHCGEAIGRHHRGCGIPGVISRCVQSSRGCRSKFTRGARGNSADLLRLSAASGCVAVPMFACNGNRSSFTRPVILVCLRAMLSRKKHYPTYSAH